MLMRGRIANGQMYEAHQAVRTIAARYIRQKAYGEAIEILYNASKQLLEAKEAGSASDLTLYLISTYNLAETPVDGDSKARLVELVTKFDPSEPTLKSIAHEATQWSGKFGTNPFGDRELHHVFGSLFVRADEAYEAEKHLLLGTKESAPLLAAYCMNGTLSRKMNSLLHCSFPEAFWVIWRFKISAMQRPCLMSSCPS